MYICKEIVQKNDHESKKFVIEDHLKNALSMPMSKLNSKDWLFPDGRFEAQGLFGQLIYIAPDQNVVIVKLSAWPEGVVDEMEFESYAFFEAAISALEGF